MTVSDSPFDGGLVLYDGECGLCDRSVQWCLRRDHARVLRYAPLQGETAAPWRDPKATTFDTIVFVARQPNGQLRRFERSRAAFEILRRVGGGWSWLAWFRYLPAWLTDLPYRLIAVNRIRWFGRVDACRLPDPATRALFLP